jgi:hypothetical protein
VRDRKREGDLFSDGFVAEHLGGLVRKRPHQSSERDQITYDLPLIYTDARRNSATCGTKQGH